MKKLTSAAALAVFLLGSGAAVAQDGQFFVNGSVGQSRFTSPSWGASTSDKTDTQGSLRLGYLWRSGGFQFGPEVGYVDLGQLDYRGTYSAIGGNGQGVQTPFRDTLSAKGWLWGGTVKYNFETPWYISARAGWFQAKVTDKYEADGTRWRSSGDSTQWYAGLGVGYNFSRSWSLGVGYDYYRLGRYTDGVNTYSVTAEFRF
ncbi:outer membrane protein [Dyella sp. C9]|uniref:outer membrane protein n=1 Tax=Dyella sp. C9 TaxID=2202154 RepID=UPI001300B6D3|nr:outer membrane beta-barrel protein [Dyella sp. C9]